MTDIDNKNTLEEEQRSRGKKKGCATLGGGCLGIVLLLVVLLACAAVGTKPSEMTMRETVYRKYGPLVRVAGGVCETLGVCEITYNDYLFFSTLSVKIGNKPEMTAAIGFFGQVITGKDLETDKPTNRPR